MYRWFSFYEARGASPCFESWAAGVAEDPELLARIDELPSRERQPNLVFAAARFVGIEPGPFQGFRTSLLDRWDQVRAVTGERRTQTNEVGRCTTLLPALAQIDGPLALIEVGASAGLCLYPDRFGYQFGDGPALTPGPEEGWPLLHCDVEGPVPVPEALPEVVWRAGIDINPLDVSDADERDDRAPRLRQSAHAERAARVPLKSRVACEEA